MRLIDADALVEALNKAEVPYRADVQNAIDNAPTIDAVPVVRCKDCFMFGECKAAEWYGDNGNGYCSVGDRRKDDG